jgi:hypothetical protein
MDVLLASRKVDYSAVMLSSRETRLSVSCPGRGPSGRKRDGRSDLNGSTLVADAIITGVISAFALPLSSCPVPPSQDKPATIHGIPAKCAKMHARCANCERPLAFLPSCASL